MGWSTTRNRPLTHKQMDVLHFLHQTIPEYGPQSCQDITDATGYVHSVSFTLQTLRFRGLVELGKEGGRLVATAVNSRYQYYRR